MKCSALKYRETRWTDENEWLVWQAYLASMLITISLSGKKQKKIGCDNTGISFTVYIDYKKSSLAFADVQVNLFSRKMNCSSESLLSTVIMFIFLFSCKQDFREQIFLAETTVARAAIL